MRIIFAETAWEDYLYWQQTDKKILKRINALIKDIARLAWRPLRGAQSPFEGIGDPEPLKYDWSGFWSRRITQEHRLVYTVEDNAILIAQCRYHY